MQTSNLVKIRFRLDPDDWHGHPNELVWAEPVNDSTVRNSAFRLRNSPFLAKGVSNEDVVRATSAPDGVYEFQEILQTDGHSTYVLLVPFESGRFSEFWRRLEKLGCTYESGKIRVSMGLRQTFSVDVPPDSDIHAVYAILEEAERADVWHFQESHLGHSLRS